MAYRLLLPSTQPVSPARVEQALSGLDRVRTSRTEDRWRVRDLAGEPEHNGDSQLIIEIKTRSAVTREPYESFFFVPHGVQEWVEVLVPRAPINRQTRLHARLVALTLSERLRLPAIETRNGVYCKTPEAFAAWCSREQHPDTVLLAERDHVTVAPTLRIGVRRSQVATGVRAVAGVAERTAPLPQEGRLRAWWHRVTGARPYVIPLPARVEPRVIDALVVEIAATFQSHNVQHDPRNHRLIVYTKDTRGARDAVSYFRRRAHPERLRRTTVG